MELYIILSKHSNKEISNVSFETAILNIFKCTGESVLDNVFKDKMNVLFDSNVYN